MSEIEVKVLNIDVNEIKEKLIKIGAKHVKLENQTNYMFDYPDNMLFRNYKGFCRIREVRNLLDDNIKYVLAIKKMAHQGEYREMIEEETEVLNFDGTYKFLIELGLVNTYTHKKHRESYKLDELLFEIDTWDKEVFPNPYLEIEAPNEEKLKKGLELLGLTLEDATSKNMAEILADMNK